MVADDSTAEYFTKNEVVISEYDTSLKIRHVAGCQRHATDRGYRVNEATKQTIRLIDTAYFSISSDDDLCLAPTYFSAAKAFLDNNEEYAAVHADEVKVYFDRNFSFRGKTFRKRWLDHSHFDDAFMRFSEYIYLKSMSYYGVVRTSKILDIFDGYKKEFDREIFYREMNTSLSWLDEEVPWIALVHISGKVKKMPCARMHVRSVHASPDRIEMAKFAKAQNVFNSGPIIELLTKDGANNFKQLCHDLSWAIAHVGSRVPKNEIEEGVLRLLWRVTASFKGQGIESLPSVNNNPFGGKRRLERGLNKIVDQFYLPLNWLRLRVCVNDYVNDIRNKFKVR